MGFKRPEEEQKMVGADILVQNTGAPVEPCFYNNVTESLFCTPILPPNGGKEA